MDHDDQAGRDCVRRITEAVKQYAGDDAQRNAEAAGFLAELALLFERATCWPGVNAIAVHSCAISDDRAHVVLWLDMSDGSILETRLVIRELVAAAHEIEAASGAPAGVILQ